MCIAILAAGLLMQQVFGGQMEVGANTPLDWMSEQVRADAARQLLDQATKREAALREKQFVDRFNELVLAMGQFSKKYKSEHVIDVKAVQSIKKAYKNLEKADPWFKSVE